MVGGKVAVMPIVGRGNRCVSIRVIVIRRQEVKPMNTQSTMGTHLQSTITRLR